MGRCFELCKYYSLTWGMEERFEVLKVLPAAKMTPHLTMVPFHV